MPAALERSAKDVGLLSHAVLSHGVQLRLRATGGSMQPTISNQEILLIEPITEAPQVGDVLLYKTNTGRLIAHRVVLIIPNFRRTSLSRYLMQGDAVRTFDGWIQKHQILGNVVAKEINGSAVSLPKRSFVMLGPRLSKTFLFSLAVKIRRLIRGRSKK